MLIDDESTDFAEAAGQKIMVLNPVQWQGLSRKNLGLKLPRKTIPPYSFRCQWISWRVS